MKSLLSQCELAVPLLADYDYRGVRLSVCRRGHVVRKPAQQKRQPKKREVLAIDASNIAAVRNAAQVAQYQSSPYHRVTGSRMGTFPAARRWTTPASVRRSGIGRQQPAPYVKRSEQGGCRHSGTEIFPDLSRHLDWEAEILYEARLSNRELGDIMPTRWKIDENGPKAFRRPTRFSI